MVGIFPEGTTHDRPQLAPIRTGAAPDRARREGDGSRGAHDRARRAVVRGQGRVALTGARPGGGADGRRPRDRRHPPARLHGLRRRPGGGARSHGGDHGPAACRVTGLRNISRGRRILTSGRRRSARRHATTTAIRTAGAAGTPRHSSRPRCRNTDRTEVVNDSGVTPWPSKSSVSRTRSSYPARLRRACFAGVLWLAIGVLLLAPFAIAGVLINFIPATHRARGRPPRPVAGDEGDRSLARRRSWSSPLTWLAVAWFDVGGAFIAGVLTALTFPLSPLIDVVFDGRAGFWPSLLVFVTAPIFGLCAILILEWAVGLFRMARGWFAVYAAAGAGRRGHGDAHGARRRSVGRRPIRPRCPDRTR